MSTPTSVTKKFKVELYRKSQEDLRQLAGRIPGGDISVLAKEVLERLAQREPKLPDPLAHPSDAQIEELCHALISDDEDAGADIILGVRAEGASPEVVYLKYLAAAARMLGEWWVEDRVSFVTVTMGSSRIFSIMRAMSHLFAPKVQPAQKSAVFASVPGETHSIGVKMATDIFRKEGWTIDLKIGLSQDELIEQIDWQQTCLIGLSVGGHHSFEALSKLVVALRIHGPGAKILIAGQDTEEVADLAQMLSVDAVAHDVDQALLKMDQLWDGVSIH